MKVSPHKSVAVYTKQFINCWLAYALAQPVNIDVPVVLYFIGTYTGVPKVKSLFKKFNYPVSSVQDKTSMESIDNLVS